MGKKDTLNPIALQYGVTPKEEIEGEENPIARAIRAITTCQVIPEASITFENRREMMRTSAAARVVKARVFVKIFDCATDIDAD